ncbi:MAG: hypothetical protein E6249_04295 [Peptoniphilus grossensis]|uniref:hypothetical protein n=1 Tax=Peptoniphilus grossensis TaxID=1465756 RepID=UPI0025859562|nr:hypothetical protein [Peptoniphilus grossensis]MDU5099674.1 hypothetical protein [Peptoniphilus grossensis]
MNRIYVSADKSNIYFSYDNVKEIVLDLKIYNNVVENMDKDEYKFFERIISNYEINTQRELEKNFLYLFNFILINNLANYLLDKARDIEADEIVFDEKIKRSKKQIIKLSSKLDVEDALGDLIICLINSDEYLDGKVKIDYGKIESEVSEKKKVLIEDIFRYRASKVDDFRNKLLEDLVAFKFVNQKSLEEENLYKLPIYIDQEGLSNNGIENYIDFLPNWTSLAYLKMLEKIYNYFVDYYKLDYDKGLNNNELLLALIEILDYEVKDYPQGLEKSIEVGRSTAGKCFFIDSFVTPLALSQELALVLQSKDAFGVVPKVFKNN